MGPRGAGREEPPFDDELGEPPAPVPVERKTAKSKVERAAVPRETAVPIPLEEAVAIRGLQELFKREQRRKGEKATAKDADAFVRRTRTIQRPRAGRVRGGLRFPAPTFRPGERFHRRLAGVVSGAVGGSGVEGTGSGA